MPIDDISPARDVVQNILPLDAVIATATSSQKKQQEKRQHPPQKKQVRDYFNPLSKAVEMTNHRLKERKLPYRFNVYKRWGDVFIELYILDDAGNVKEKQRKNISYEDFNRIIDDVTVIEGLFLDYRA